MSSQIAFIGGGNMARSLIGGLIARGRPAADVIVSDPVPQQLETLRAAYGVRTAASNLEAASNAGVVVLAVKPQDLRAVVVELSATLRSTRPLLLSVAAGILASDIERWAGVPVVRCMPNRPALQGCGMTGLFATPGVPTEHRRLAAEILGAVGETIWLTDERQMDAVTALSGSGPAYFFLLIEMMEDAGVAMGLPRDISRKLAIETAYGSGRMAREASEPPATLREQVTSKGGTTEAALRHLESNGIRSIFAGALAAAAKRSAELARELGKI
ncbi:MAG: pyrroline-5-carboxylate reductase [Gammaproteobacteria bacterium]|mgnify:CR=1 FL=1|nr:pyrroline-5-carboxylate reductase [Gammaproteobacteria bacterium]